MRENSLVLDGRLRLHVRFCQESMCGVVLLPCASNPFVERFQAAHAVDGEVFDDRQSVQLLIGDDEGMPVIPGVFDAPPSIELRLTLSAQLV